MRPKQVVMAWLEEMQAMVTVWAGIRSEKPAPRAASRAMLDVFTSCTHKCIGNDNLVKTFSKTF